MNSTTQSPPTVQMPIGTWQIDPVHSTVGFEVRDMTHLASRAVPVWSVPRPRLRRSA